MKVFRYLIPFIALVVQACATIVSTQDVAGPYILTGLSSTNPVYVTSGIPFQQASDILVVDVGQSGAVRSPAVVLVQGADYTVAGGGYNTSNQMQLGTIKVVVNTGSQNVLAGDSIYVLHNSPANQLSVFANSGYLTASMIEQGLDKSAILAQQALNGNAASLHVESWETGNSVPPVLLMPLAARAGKLLGFDSYGNVSFTTNAGGGSSGGIQSVSGTSGQITAVTTNNAVTVGLATTAVTAGNYTNTNLTVDAYGRITSASNGSSSGGVTQIVAGTGITISPSGGTGVVTINASGTAGVTSATGTANQVLVNGTSGSAQTGGLTFTTPQNIDTSASVQFGNLSIGSTLPAQTGVNTSVSVTSTGSGAKGVRLGSTLTAGVVSDSLYSVLVPAAVSTNYSGSVYYQADLATPTFSGSGSVLNAYQLYLAGMGTPGVTVTNKYGIFQQGTEPNQLAGPLTVPNFTATGTTTLATSLNGLLKASSGVVSAATSGSDYAPATTGTSILKANGFGGFANAVSGTDYAPATSGTSLLYGNGSGGFSNATVSSANLTFTSGTLNTIQNINTTASPQFFSVGLGSGAGPAFGALSIQGTYNGSSLFSTSPFGIIDTPTLAPAANSQTMIGLTVTPTLSPASYTSLSYTGLYLGNPTGGGSGVSTAYQIYIAAAPTATTKYGIYQAGSDTNVLNNLTLGSLTGILKGTSGVISTATSGTDYAPATSGTSLLYGNGSGGFSNASVGSSLSFSAGTLNTVQGITTTSNPQFGSLGIGAAASGTSGDLFVNSTFAVGSTSSYTAINLSPSITSTGVNAKGVRIIPTTTAGVTSDSLYSTILGGVAAASTYTGGTYYETYLATPTFTNSGSGNFLNAYQLFIAGIGTTSVTVTNKYGIYQQGTDPNYFGGAFTMATTAKQATNQNLTPGTTTVTSGSSITIDWSKGNSFDLTLTSATAATVSFSNAVDGQVITIAIHQPASGTATTVSWSGVSTIKWSGGTAPTQTATLSKTDVYTIYYNATAGAYYGSYVQNF